MCEIVPAPPERRVHAARVWGNQRLRAATGSKILFLLPRVSQKAFDPVSFYDQVVSGQIQPEILERALTDPSVIQAFFDNGRALPGTGSTATVTPPEIAMRMTQDPRAALARTNAARAVAGMDRTQLEKAIKDLFAKLNQEGVALEARPGSKLAEGLANGDLSQLSPDELMAVLIALALYGQNRKNAGQVAGQANNPLAPSGSWGANGNRWGGGTSTTGANGNAAAPTGPAPSGPAPGGTVSGQHLAQCAANVAGRMGSTGYCYRGVKAAVREATGVQLTGGSAYQAADQLASSGRFSEVSVSPSELRNLPPGAVVVWGQTDASPHGHISVSLGDGREASDHVQTQMTSLRGAQNYRVFVPA